MGGCISFQISCDQVLNRVGSCFCGRGNYIRNLEKNLVALEKATGVLKARRDDMLRRVQREEGKGLQRLNEVQVWLRNVQTIENHFSDLDSTTIVELQRLCLCGVCSKNLTSSFEYGRRVSLMLKEVENLKSNGVFEVMAEPAMRYVVEEMPLQPIIFGRETMLERAWNRLMGDETGIMGLYGMGGVGKTTLLTQINNKFREAIDGLEIVIWVVVSNDLRIEKIQDEIAELVVLDLSQNLRLDGLLEEISELVSLKYLDLSRTMIERLPACLRKLKKLMHLYLEGMRSLRSIDGISSLSSLRTLKLLRCNKLRFEASLKELLLLKHLEVLTIEIESRLVLGKLFFSPMGRKCIQKVVIKDIHASQTSPLLLSCLLPLSHD